MSQTLEGSPVRIPHLNLFNRETQRAVRDLNLRRLENGDLEANTPDGRRKITMTHEFNLRVASYIRKDNTIATFPIPGFPEEEMPQAA
jgi:hypothetical protein